MEKLAQTRRAEGVARCRLFQRQSCRCLGWRCLCGRGRESEVQKQNSVSLPTLPSCLGRGRRDCDGMVWYGMVWYVLSGCNCCSGRTSGMEVEAWESCESWGSPQQPAARSPAGASTGWTSSVGRAIGQGVKTSTNEKFIYRHFSLRGGSGFPYSTATQRAPQEHHTHQTSSKTCRGSPAAALNSPLPRPSHTKGLSSMKSCTSKGEEAVPQKSCGGFMLSG